jgi:selenocysteine-specific elongation factor
MSHGAGYPKSPAYRDGMHVIGTAGHVDHGKSALVTALTGIDPDRWAEEKRRGLTIDLGFAWLKLPSGREVGIVDVPGHERFIRNMLAGAGGISICLFVVDASEGWMPQSAEHLGVLEVLGIRTAVVALTKVDAVDGDILQMALDEVREKLAGTSLAQAPIVPCSALTGTGLDQLIAALDRALDEAPVPVDRDRARLWIDRVFTIAGAGTVVTGTLAGGSIRTGESVELLGPTASRRERIARVRSIQSHKRETESISPGHRAALNLVGLGRRDAQRGDAIVHPGKWRATKRFDAALTVLPVSISQARHELTERGSHLLYVGSAETQVKIKLLDIDRVPAGGRAFAQLTLRAPLPLARGDRFVLRDAGRVATIGGGEVLDPLATSVRRKHGDRIDLLKKLQATSPEDAMRALLEAEAAIPIEDALIRSGATKPEPDIIQLGDKFVSDSRFKTLEIETLGLLERHHSSKTLERGMPYEQLRAALELEPKEFEDLISRIDGIAVEGAIVRMSSHKVLLSNEQEVDRARIAATVHAAGFSPPFSSELDGDSDVLQTMLDSGDLVKVGDFYISSERAREARALVRSHIEANGPMTVAEIRDLLGTSRKYAVPLCEWLDQTGATRRRGDVRILGLHA